MAKAKGPARAGRAKDNGAGARAGAEAPSRATVSSVS